MRFEIHIVRSNNSNTYLGHIIYTVFAVLKLKNKNLADGWITCYEFAEAKWLFHGDGMY